MHGPMNVKQTHAPYWIAIFGLSGCTIFFSHSLIKGTIFPPTQYCAGGKIKKNEVGEACGTYGGVERCAQGCNGETQGKEAIGETQTQMGEQY